MDKKKVLYILIGDKYYSIDDLRYNKKTGFLFSKDDLKEFLDIKNELVCSNFKINGKDLFVKIPIKTFNSDNIFFCNGEYLLSKYSDYLMTLVDDYNQTKELFANRHMKQMITSRIFSEIEGTLNIENVPTTHKRIKQVFANDNLTDKNDIIIKNMQNAINYILNERPAFNKENLFKLYSLLSDKCLDEDEKLKDGEYYRDDKVYIGGYEGVDYRLIDEYMNSLFELVNNKDLSENLEAYLPHICHYYILYLHPYFDYNGRTARMVSFWISMIKDLTNINPLFMSEAINEFKSDYYKAIVNTRNTKNDLTYFLGYIFETAKKFSLIYKNIEEIKNKLSENGNFLSDAELIYLKKILVHNPEKFFNYKMFIEYIKNNISKQGALKILNHLTDFNIITKSLNKKKETIFKVNPEYITYKLD